MSIQSMQEFIPIRTPVANEKLSEGMLSWSLVLPPVSNILQIAASTKRDIMPVRMVRNISPFTNFTIGGSALLPKDFQSSTINPTPPTSTTTPPTTSGQTGNPPTTSGTTHTAPLPIVTTGDIPVSYAVYTFKPSITRSVATVTQLRSIVISLTYYLPDWTFAIWIPSIQRYIEYYPSAPSTVPNNWITINAANNIEASGSAAIEFIFGLRTAQLTDLTAPYGSILVNNYKVDEHLFVSTLGVGGGGGVSDYPPAGVAVSTGDAWDTSIPAANIATLNGNNTFVGSNIFGGYYSWFTTQTFLNGPIYLGSPNTVDPSTVIQPGGALSSPAITVAGSPVCTEANPCNAPILELRFNSVAQAWSPGSNYVISPTFTGLGNIAGFATNNLNWSPVDCTAMYLYVLITNTVAGSSPSSEPVALSVVRENATEGWVNIMAGVPMSWAGNPLSNFLVVDLSNMQEGAIKAGDILSMNMHTPDWSVAPSSLSITAILYAKVTGVITGGLITPLAQVSEEVGYK